jgi:formylglycine-generating enzyme required for sulfatase activity
VRLSPPLLLALLVALGAGTFVVLRRTTSGTNDTLPADRTEQRPSGPAPEGMLWIPGGEFTMGTDDGDAWADEGPAHRVRVRGLWMDVTEVTNRQFEAFVMATGYRTTAERAPTAEELLAQMPPGTEPPAPEDLVPGALVFMPTDGPVPLDDIRSWWSWTPGASWRHPEGPASDLEGRGDHPVVQVSWDDAVAYARWAKKRLPTEAEWEHAARGGLDAQRYVWGSQALAPGFLPANVWQGEFPWKNTREDGFERTAPVKTFPPNGYGLYDMSGNVWEWCADWYDRELHDGRRGSGCSVDPQGPEASHDAERPFMPQRVQKGGSFLCHDSYCSRYRPSARHGCTPDSGMSHVGFRCVRSP